MNWFADLVGQAMRAVSEASPLALGALAAVAALTEVGVPFPFVIDAVLLYVGYETLDVVMRALPVLLALFLGRVAGSAVIYGLARLVGNPFLNWLVRRIPRIASHLEALKKSLGAVAPVAESGKRGRHVILAGLRSSLHVPVAVCVARLTPGLLTTATVASGAIGMHFG